MLWLYFNDIYFLSVTHPFHRLPQYNLSVQNFSLRKWGCYMDELFTKQGENKVNPIDLVTLLELIGHFPFLKVRS